MEKKCFSFLTMTQPMKGHGLFVYLGLPTSFSSLLKCSPSLSTWRLACGSAWLQTLNCSSLVIQVNPSLLVKYLAGYLFQVNNIDLRQENNKERGRTVNKGAVSCTSYCSITKLALNCQGKEENKRANMTLHIEIKKI